MENIVIVDAENLCISPSDINTDKHFFGAFGNTETEASAKWIVLLCQKKGGWYPFTLKEVEDLCQSVGYKGYWFNNLLDMKFIIEKKSIYYITSEFITRCYSSSPKRIKTEKVSKNIAEEVVGKITAVRIVGSKNGRDGGEHEVLAKYPRNEGSGITMERDCRVDVEIDGKWRKIWELRISSRYRRHDLDGEVEKS
jgi:hypothetical protein